MHSINIRNKIVTHSHLADAALGDAGGSARVHAKINDDAING